MAARRWQWRALSIWPAAVRHRDEWEVTMVYIMMIYADESDWVHKTEAEMAPIMAEHDKLEADLRKAGKYRGCGGLAPSSAAKTVRIGDGKSQVLDGPYPETKEMFGGYYLVEAETIDEVVEYAKRIPGFARRAVEVRPIAAFRAG
jgi:hypothetical protein